MNEINMSQTLKKMLTLKRYEHSISVQQTAIELAKVYGCDCKKASIAGLLHDCAKDLKKDDLLKKCEQYGVAIDEIIKKEAQLLHGYVGVEIAKQTFEVFDQEILNAIKYHTIANENMSLLDKIIYISDFIEPGRNFDGVDIIRKFAYKDLDKAIIIGIDNTIALLLSKGKLIHPDTIKARNSILINKRNS